MRSSTYVLWAVLLCSAQVAHADKPMRQARYVGIHPIPAVEGGGFCEIEAPHVHVFAANKLEYRPHDGYSFFVGDPVAYGYSGPRHAYKGHHSIHVNAVVGDPDDDLEFCYLDGPHFHAFEPAVAAEFELVGDTYFYVAEPPPVYVEARPAMIRINAMYTPIRYSRPVVTVAAPRGWIGVRAGYAVAEVNVRAPVIVVQPPSLDINIGFGVGVGVDGRRRHDNGKHKGWSKHGKNKRHW